MDYDRPPDAVITASCAIDEGSFADVDSDGIDDLVLRSGDKVFSWPTTHAPGEPQVWRWGEPGEASWIDVSTPNTGPARVNWSGTSSGGTYEYGVDPATLALVGIGSGEPAHEHIGDVDGDGEADAFARYTDADEGRSPISVRASSTGLYRDLPGFGYLDYAPWPYEYSPYYAWSVGDMNHDGYDDLLVGQRQLDVVDRSEDDYSTDLQLWGPAQLWLGSATGIQTEPLWTLFAPDLPMAGVGRGVAALPDEGALVVTVATEGLFYGDFSPELLGVIRDADTPHAYFDQLVKVPALTPGGFTPYLQGWLDDGNGQRALAMLEVTGSTGVQWFQWFPDGAGFMTTGATSVGAPSASWRPPGNQILDGYLSPLAFPVGRQNQAILLGLYTETGYQLIEWGRPPDQLGIPAGGVTTEGCTFTASVDGTGGTGQTSDTADEAPGPKPGSDGRGCGCDTRSGYGWLAVALLAPLVRRREERVRTLAT